VIGWEHQVVVKRSVKFVTHLYIPRLSKKVANIMFFSTDYCLLEENEFISLLFN